MKQQITIEPWEKYDTTIAEQVGALQPQLDPTFSGEPVPRDHFEKLFVDNPQRTMLLAIRAGKRVAGVATMNLLAESSPQASDAYMGGFVVDENERGYGVADTLWDGMLDWCKERDLPGFTFKTEADRTAALNFYRRMGARLIAGDATTEEMFFAARAPRIPAAVLSSFSHRLADVYPLGEGRVHETYVVADGSKKVVIQKVNEDFPHTATRDTADVSRALAVRGWEVPLPITNRSGSLTVADYERREWRCQTYIENDPAPKDLSEKSLSAIGQLLAKWHATAAKIDHEPQFNLPHFHETEFHKNLLSYTVINGQVKHLPSRVLARDIMAQFDELPTIPSTPRQLIHGDPQLNNMLFRKDLPFTLIDLDTVMPGNIWVDIGDLLRSVLERQADSGRELDIAELEPIMRGYWEQSPNDMDYASFKDSALLATQHIALELAMRFIIDQSNNYFAWDEANFASRREHHYARALLQQQIAATVA